MSLGDCFLHGAFHGKECPECLAEKRSTPFPGDPKIVVVTNPSHPQYHYARCAFLEADNNGYHD